MDERERTSLVAPCGIDCGQCELNMCKNNEKMLNYFIEKGYPKDKLPCNGCRSIEGMCPVIKEKCKTYDCITAKGLDFCYECGEFPCNKLHPCADRANILPHNQKVYNLCVIKKIGVEGFVKISDDIKKKYYTGKMDIGNGPQA